MRISQSIDHLDDSTSRGGSVFKKLRGKTQKRKGVLKNKNEILNTSS